MFLLKKIKITFNNKISNSYLLLLKKSLLHHALTMHFSLVTFCRNFHSIKKLNRRKEEFRINSHLKRIKYAHFLTNKKLL